MKRIIVTVVVLLVAASAVAMLLGRGSEHRWTNPFLVSPISALQESLGENSSPAKLDKALHDGQVDAAYRLLAIPGKEVNFPEDGRVVSHDLRRETVVAGVQSQGGQPTRVTVFYSYRLALNGENMTPRPFLAVEWRIREGAWLPYSVITTDPFVNDARPLP